MLELVPLATGLEIGFFLSESPLTKVEAAGEEFFLVMAFPGEMLEGDDLTAAISGDELGILILALPG